MITCAARLFSSADRALWRSVELWHCGTRSYPELCSQVCAWYTLHFKTIKASPIALDVLRNRSSYETIVLQKCFSGGKNKGFLIVSKDDF